MTTANADVDCWTLNVVAFWTRVCFCDKSFSHFLSLYEDDFDEDEDLPEGDIMALKGLENDEDNNAIKNTPWTMVTGIDDDIDDNDDDDDDDFY